MAVGLGVLGLPPAVFWAMSPKELEAALRGRTGGAGGAAVAGGVRGADRWRFRIKREVRHGRGLGRAGRDLDRAGRRRYWTAGRAAQGRYRLGRQFSSALINAFEGIAIKGQPRRGAPVAGARPLQHGAEGGVPAAEQGFGGLLSGLFSGGFGFAKGGVSSRACRCRSPRAASCSPNAFPLARGRTGIAGERGAEAIMPLARGPDGRLGVVSQGGGGISVTFNVATPDARASADRRRRSRRCWRAPSRSGSATSEG